MNEGWQKVRTLFIDFRYAHIIILQRMQGLCHFCAYLTDKVHCGFLRVESVAKQFFDKVQGLIVLFFFVALIGFVRNGHLGVDISHPFFSKLYDIVQLDREFKYI